MIIFIDKKNCINLHEKLINQDDKYKSYMLMQTIVDNVNHIHFNFDDSEKETILSEISDKREDLKRFTLWGNVEGVGNTTFSYKNSSIDNENKFTGIHPLNRFDKNFPFNDLYQEYLSSAFMLDVDDKLIKEYKRKVMICGIGKEMELMESIYKLATSGNFNLIGKPFSNIEQAKKITRNEVLIKLIAKNYKELFPDDIPFTYIIVDDPYFMSETENNDNLFIDSFFYAINSIVSNWKEKKLVDSDHKVQILIYHHKANPDNNAEKNKIEQTIKHITNLLQKNKEYMKNITAKNSGRNGHDRWIYTNYYALASGRGFVSAGGTTYMRFPRMGSNADVINNLIGNRTSDTTDQENEVNPDDVNEFYSIIDAFLNSEQCISIKNLNIVNPGQNFNPAVIKYYKTKIERDDNDIRCKLAYHVLNHKDYFNQFRENLKSRAKVFKYLNDEEILNDDTLNKIDQYLTQSCLAVFAYRIIDILRKIQLKRENAKTEKTR